MTDGNLELVQVVVSWMVTLPAVVAIIVRDERRLRGVELARAWPPSSRDAAIFGLWNMGIHPFCLVVHFARTRRSARGAILGLGWLVLVLAAGFGAELGVTEVIGWLSL